MGVRAVTASSEHPVPACAVGECAGELLERGASGSDLLWVAVDTSFAGTLDDVVATLESVVSAKVTAAVTSASVLGGGRVIRESAAIAVLAVRGVDCHVAWLAPGVALEHLLEQQFTDHRGAVAVIAQPTFPSTADLVVPEGSAVTGGYLMPGNVARSTPMVVEGVTRHSGALVIGFAADTGVTVSVTHGFHLVGRAVPVTGADGPLLTELEGRPAESVLSGILDDLDPGALSAASEIGFAASERDVLHAVARGNGDGSLVLSDPLHVGDRVHVALRSVDAAGRDLVAAANGASAGGWTTSAALGFFDVHRPTVFDPGHRGDGALMAELFGSNAVGVACQGVMPVNPDGGRLLRGAAGLVLFG